MSLPPLADLIAFEEWLGRALPENEQVRAGAVLDAVSSLVRSEAGRTWAAGDPAVLEGVPGEVRTIVLQVARRVFLNPDNVRQEATGPFSVSYGTTAGLDLTASERAILGRFRTNPRGLWTLSTTRGDAAADTAYVPVEGGPPFPWYGTDTP